MTAATAREANFHIYAKLTLKSLSDASTVTYRLSQKSITGGSNTYYAVLKDVSGLSVAMAGEVPAASSGSLAIDCAPGSFGYERRFVDLFERYTIIDQPVEIFVAFIDVIESDPESAWSRVFTGKAASWSLSRDVLNVVIQTLPVPRHTLTKVIDSDTFPDAPISSIGKALPVVIGSGVECRAYQIGIHRPNEIYDDPTPIWPVFGYAVSLGSDFEVSGITGYHAKNADGDFVRVISATTTITEEIQTNTPSSPVALGMLAATGGVGNATRIPVDTSVDNFIVTNVTIKIENGYGAGVVVSGELIVAIWDHDSNLNRPGKIIAEGRIAKEDLTSLLEAGSSYFSQLISFNRPAVLSGSDYYYLEIRQTGDTGDTHEIVIIGSSGEETVVSFHRPEVGAEGQYGDIWIPDGEIGEVPWYTMRAVQFFDDYPANEYSTDANGLLPRWFTAGSSNSEEDGQTEPDLAALDLIVVVDGLEDNGDGDITGVANQLLESPLDIAQALCATWDGTNWTPAGVDTSYYSGTHAALDSGHGHYRKIAGRSEGRRTAADVLSSVLVNSGCRLGLVPSATAGAYFGLWAWGTTEASVATITDEESEFVGLESRGSTSIVNNLELFFAPSLRALDITSGSAEGEFRNYAGIVRWEPTTNVTSQSLAELSSDIFGAKYLANPTFNFIGDSTSAELLATYILATFGQPLEYASFRVPLSLFNSLKVLDIVTIIHPAIPAYFGTSSDPSPSTYEGLATTPALGHHEKRATSVRGQIEGVTYEVDSDAVPTMLLTIRLLNNYPKDPT